MYSRNLMKNLLMDILYHLMKTLLSLYSSNLSDPEPCYAILCSLSQPYDIRELPQTYLAHDSLANIRKENVSTFKKITCNCHKSQPVAVCTNFLL